MKDPLWILQREITLEPAKVTTLVKPAIALIGTLLGVPTGKIPVATIFRVAVFVGQNAGSICVMNDILAKKQLVLDQVIDESAEKHNVSPGADRHPDVGERACARSEERRVGKECRSRGVATSIQ